MKLPFCGALPASLVRLTVLSLAGIAILPNSAAAATVGVPTQKMRSIYAAQLQSEWCWAACIQMVAAFYDVDLPQGEIVRRAFGSYANQQGTDALISSCLAGSATNRSGKVCRVHSKQYHNPQAVNVLVSELSAGRPVLIGFDSGAGDHMVLCTALEYSGSKSDPTITSFTVRDPWPDADNQTTQGRRVWGGMELGSRITSIWTVEIKPSTTTTETASYTSKVSYMNAAVSSMLEQARQNVKIQQSMVTTAQQQLQFCLNGNGSRALIATAQRNLQNAQSGLRDAQSALRRIENS